NGGHGVYLDAGATDNTIGGGTLSVTRLNVSPALDGLGLDVAAVGNTIQGRDVNPVRVNSPFTALLELRQGLESNDTRQIELAGRRLEDTLTQMQRVQGELAAKDRVMVSRGARTEDAVTQTQLQQSDVRDADMTEAIVRFQQFQTALEANMASGSKLLSLSLMDYLR
ncbi:MAG: hypothetical protein HZB38_13790, partial [Planctomycetes bacterium]|nr:hypothetical protein [Planctomycetota bacterium]